jgi:hypothetical protein
MQKAVLRLMKAYSVAATTFLFTLCQPIPQQKIKVHATAPTAK